MMHFIKLIIDIFQYLKGFIIFGRNGRDAFNALRHGLDARQLLAISQAPRITRGACDGGDHFHFALGIHFALIGGPIKAGQLTSFNQGRGLGLGKKVIKGHDPRTGIALIVFGGQGRGQNLWIVLAKGGIRRPLGEQGIQITGFPDTGIGGNVHFFLGTSDGRINQFVGLQFGCVLLTTLTTMNNHPTGRVPTIARLGKVFAGVSKPILTLVGTRRSIGRNHKGLSRAGGGKFVLLIGRWIKQAFFDAVTGKKKLIARKDGQRQGMPIAFDVADNFTDLSIIPMNVGTKFRFVDEGHLKGFLLVRGGFRTSTGWLLVTPDIGGLIHQWDALVDQGHLLQAPFGDGRGRPQEVIDFDGDGFPLQQNTAHNGRHDHHKGRALPKGRFLFLGFAMTRFRHA